MHEINLGIAEPFEKRFRRQTCRSIWRYADGSPCAERNEDIPKPRVECRCDKLAYAKTAGNLEGVDFIDSAGLGELVRSHASIRSRGGQLKLVKPSASVHHLFRITKLDRVFDIVPDEGSALSSLRQAAAAKSVG